MAQLWVENTLGGYFSNDTLSKQARVAAQPLQKFRMFCDIEPAAGKHKGEYVLFDKITNVATAGGTLSETSTIPKTNFTIVQDSLQLAERGNSIPYTLKAETLADISLPENVRTALKNDMAKVQDSAAAAQFLASDWLAVCVNTATTSFDTDSSTTNTATADMSDKNVRDIVDELKKKNVPRRNDGLFVCIASTNAIRGIYDMVEAKLQHTTYQPLMDGDIGKYYGVRFIEETNALSNAIGNGSAYGSAVFFGGDAVREGVCIPEELRIKKGDDYGRDLGMAWYGMNGYKKTWDYSTDGESRIIYVTSA